MRFFLRFLAILDVVSLFFLGLQLWYFINHYHEVDDLKSKISYGLKFPIFILIILGALSLWRIKKLAFIYYYIQFPFRIYLWIFTLGFMAFLPEAFNRFEEYWFNLLLYFLILIEFMRLFLMIKLHKQGFSRNELI